MLANLVQPIATHILNRLSGLDRATKRTMQAILDFFLLGFAAWAAFQLRLGFGYDFNVMQLWMIAIAPLCAIPIYARFGLYRQVLRYLPERALFTILEAAALATLLWLAIVFFAGQYGGDGVPRSVPLLYLLLVFSITAFTRFAAKWVIFSAKARSHGEKTLIYGAGEAGTQLAMALASSPNSLVMGFVDDDPTLAGRDIAGHRVHSPDRLADIVRDFGIESIVLCIPSVSGSRKLEIVAALAKLPVKTQIVPSITDIASGRYLIDSIQRIELGELIGRSRVPADAELIDSVVRGKRVLVTGAGGSIGSALAKLIRVHDPRQIVLVENNEFVLYEIARQMEERDGQSQVVPVLVSAADEHAMKIVFDTYSPEIVFHAAAYKHVDLVERNAAEAIRNNIGSSEILARLSYDYGVERFVLISSDKAVNPTNVMGATKRASELIVRKYAEEAIAARTGQVFLAVRFGNVVGSRGSVVPLFEEQIRNGGPLTVTDMRMTRYFMSISEAVELIVQAAALAEGGETFLLEMGEPISIYELARNMIGMSGLSVRDEDNPDGDIEIVITGAKPGEKIEEELFYDPSTNTRTKHPKIVMAKHYTDAHTRIAVELDALMKAVESGEREKAGDMLFEALDRVQNAGAKKANVLPDNVTPLRKSGS